MGTLNAFVARGKFRYLIGTKRMSRDSTDKEFRRREHPSTNDWPTDVCEPVILQLLDRPLKVGEQVPCTITLTERKPPLT